jgi:hypothetical protein
MLVESAAFAHDTLLALNRGVSALYHFVPNKRWLKGRTRAVAIAREDLTLLDI